MNKEERQSRILEILETEGSVEVARLTRLFSVSEMSIRSDLNALAARGRLQRIYGGARKGCSPNAEQPLLEKQFRNHEKKAAIGRAAAALVEDGDSIMIDAGTTTEQVAQCLLARKDLTVITNGINIVNTLLRAERIRLYTVGGEIVAKSFSIVGMSAERALEEYYAKVCIIGIDGLDFGRGLTNNSSEAATIAKIMLRRAKKKILVCDSSKIGHVALVPVCDLGMVDCLVTDSGIPADCLQKAGSLGLRVVVTE